MVKSDLKVFIKDNLIPKDVLLECESKCPTNNLNNESKDIQEFCTFPVREELGKKWNIPPDECYLKQGLVVNEDEPLEYFTTTEWKKKISKIIDVDYDRLSIKVFRYRTNIENTNGLWLHTDKDLEPNRNIEVLIYVNNEEWKPEYGGELLLFSNENKIDDVDRKEYNEWQNGREMSELSELNIGDIIRTKGIGGPWHSHDKLVDFKLEKKIPPLFGRVVIIDYRDNYNIHAVTPKKKFNRKTIEAYWSYE